MTLSSLIFAPSARNTILLEKGSLLFGAGLLVCHFKSPVTVHAIFQPGDIITSINGKPCRTFGDYQAKKGSVMVFWRLDARGEFVRHEEILPLNQSPIALVDLTDE